MMNFMEAGQFVSPKEQFIASIEQPKKVSFSTFIWLPLFGQFLNPVEQRDYNTDCEWRKIEEQYLRQKYFRTYYRVYL